MKILGISAFYHDSAAAIIVNGKIVAAAHEERFTRKKNDSDFPHNAITYCLVASSCQIDELDAVVFYDKAFLKFERLIETYYRHAPKGWISFLKTMPIWLKEKVFLKRMIYKGLKRIHTYDKKKLKLLFPEHHLSHAASAFYPSSFESAAILTIDGVGEWATTTICEGIGKQIRIYKEVHFPNSVGLLYSAFTSYLGFRVNSGEYKMMGLAPYGIEDSDNFKRFTAIIKKEIISIKADGSIWMNPKYFKYSTQLRMLSEPAMEEALGVPRREPESSISQWHCDLALSIQRITEDIILLLAAEAKKVTGSDFLCLAGGVALNSVANGKIEKSGLFKELFIQPAAGDAGGALGAALAANHIYFDQERKISWPDGMSGAYLGPRCHPEKICALALRKNCKFKLVLSEDELVETVAKMINQGKVVGWIQGRSEFGPRALGARSILGDATNPMMQKIVNQKIKFRESFRPFAPAVLEEDSAKLFEMNSNSPYMLKVVPLAKKICNDPPKDYATLSMIEKLAFRRSSLPAVTHVDYSARIQTVSKKTNRIFWKLLSAYKKLSGYGVLINTSFNVRDEPIVNTADDAFRCFIKSDMDYLVIENYIFSKDNS